MSYAAFLRDHNATFAAHRKSGWWAPFETPDGFPEVLEYHAVRELLADDAHMGAVLGDYIGDVMRSNPELSPEHIAAMTESNGRALINLDGEAHHRLRALVSRNFTPRSVANLRPFLDRTAAELVKDLHPGEDFMRSFARALPARGLCALTGIPEQDHGRFIGWIDELEVQGSPEELAHIDRARSERVLAADRSLRAYCRELIHARRADPQDDLVSRLANDPESHADDATIEQLLVDLIFAGNDTTRHGLGAMVLMLADCPHAWEAVAADPERAPAVVEEVLRLESPAPGPVRQVRETFAYRDHTFPAGQVAACSIWSANRDEAFWGADAGEFNPDREHAGQAMTFGHGAHFCLGASLAREEMRAALVALSSAIRDVQVLETPVMQPAGSIYGPKSLVIDFNPRYPR
jgi:cytochrome P450